MRFLILLKKELRESVPWIVLAVLSLLSISWFMIRMKTFDLGRWHYNVPPNGTMISQHMIFRTDILQESAVLMFFTSLGLGLILGIRHFWVPGFTGTWQYLIHRSVSRTVIVTAKLAAAAILMLCLLMAWLLLARYTHASGRVIIPPESGIVGLGIYYTCLGFIVYLGTALCALTRARWYTTRMFGLLFIFIMFLLILSQTSIVFVLFSTVFIFAVLIVQVYVTFLQKEF